MTTYVRERDEADGHQVEKDDHARGGGGLLGLQDGLHLLQLVVEVLVAHVDGLVDVEELHHHAESLHHLRESGERSSPCTGRWRTWRRGWRCAG